MFDAYPRGWRTADPDRRGRCHTYVSSPFWQVAVGLLSTVSVGCGAASQEVGPGVAGGIGHDVCAVLISVNAAVTDADRQPIPGAEVWEETQFQPDLPGARAVRLGRTDGAGRLGEPQCLMGSVEVRYWRSPDTLEPRFMVMKEGYSFRRVAVPVRTSTLLELGGALGVPPGVEFEWSDLDSGRRATRFLVPLAVMLEQR